MECYVWALCANALVPIGSSPKAEIKVNTRSSRPLIYRIILLATSLLLLTFLVFPGCGPAPASTPSPKNSSNAPVTPDTPNSNDPAGKVASTPLTVLSIVGGNVQVLKPNASGWQKGEEGMTLGVDDQIKTDNGGKALITFFEGSTVELQGDTIVKLSELDINPDASTSVKIKQEIGKTISRAKKVMDPKDRYEIETDAAVAAVRGTTMYVEVRPDGTVFIGNIEGTVIVIAQGKAVQLPPGTHTTVIPGQAPGSPEPGATPPPANNPTAGVSPEPSITPTVSMTPTQTPTGTSATPTQTSTPAPTIIQTPLIATITNLEQDQTVGRNIVVSGTVNDPSVTEATLILNNVPRKISVVNGYFKEKVELADGINTITVSVTRDGVTASDSVELVPGP
jgi:hypothetical protein